MFKTRLISGILLVAAALLTIITGGAVLWTVLLCISVIAQKNCTARWMCIRTGLDCWRLRRVLGILLYYGAAALDFGRYGMMAVILALILILFVYVFTYPKYDAHQIAAAFLGIVYVAVMLSYIYLTGSGERTFYCLADLSLLLGMRYLRLLCGYADRKT